jgi:hypothetical protein
MNELIRECWLKAAREDSGEKWDTQEEFIERFAELIVKECIDIIEGLSPGYQDYRNQIEDAFCRDCVAKIKYEFGVKE